MKDITKQKRIDSTRFYSLAPTKEAENIEAYISALNWAIKEQDINNIALTGSYGSGKSSILKTYQGKSKKPKRFLNISLLTFNQKDYEKDESNIEKCILKQIFYKEKISKTPYSRFKKINNLNEKIGIKIAIILFIILSILFLINPELILNIKDFVIERLSYNFTFFNNRIDNVLNIVIKIIVSLSLIGLIIYLINLGYKFISNISWKLTVKKYNVELELTRNEKQNDESIFNKFIDEIIYFFEVTDYDVVIFEDLDRIKNNADLFMRLKELNTILNTSKMIKKKKITFIYAIKDDVFDNGIDKTKFFEFIIPIIPIMDSSNSLDKLLEMEKDELYIKKLNKDSFLNNIILYVDDMRLLKSILNEFKIYSVQIDIEYEERKLFSLILYKNLFPKDFAKLQKNKGILYKAIKEEKYNNFPKNMEVLSYLLKNKYIDKDYREYMNYFYSKTMSISDKNFIFNFNNLKRIGFFFKLHDIDKIMGLLKEEDFSKREILNLDLLYYLLQYPQKYNSQLTKIFKQVNNEDFGWFFLSQYIKRKQYFEGFVQYFVKYCSKVWYKVDRSLKQNEKNELFIKILMYAEEDDIINNFGNNKYFINKINNYKDVEELLEVEKERKILTKLKIDVSNINKK